MPYSFQLRPKTIGLSAVLALGVYAALSTLGCAPRAQTVTLDVPANHPVSIASPEVEPGASKVTAIDVPFGGAAYRYKDKDLAVLQQMLEETNPIPGAPGESFRIHVVIRRFLIAYHQSEAVGISCVAWALTNPRGELVFDETFYAAAYTGNKGVNGVKKPIQKGITKRVHAATQAVASGLPPGPPPRWVYEDYESAAASIPNELGEIRVVTLQRGGVERSVEYVGETGEEFARCNDSIDWYYRLGIPRPAEEASQGKSPREPSSATPPPPTEVEPSP